MMIMSSTLLQLLKTHTEDVIDTLSLPLPEYAVVEIRGTSKYIRLEESNVLIPFAQCKFSTTLVREEYVATILNQPKTSTNKEHQHDSIEENTNLRVQIESILKDKDEVVVIRMKKGQSFFVLAKVSPNAGL